MPKGKNNSLFKKNFYQYSKKLGEKCNKKIWKIQQNSNFKKKIN